MNRLRIVAALAFAALVVIVFWQPAGADVRPVRPVPGTVVRGYDPPPADWLPGHRGVDLAGRPGEVVVAPLPGRVAFAGEVAGTPVVSIDHPDGRRTTYQPVVASVRAGDPVAAGDPIGTLTAGHCMDESACLHLGLKRGAEYLDPSELLATANEPPDAVRLVSGSAPDRVRERATARELADTPGGPSGPGGPIMGGSTRPADGPLTSAFGMRRHPVTGVYKLHDGLDLGAACGSPIRAIRAGTVVHAVFHTAYGWWLIIDHGDGLRTGYAHASAWLVDVGSRVEAGQQIGRVGSTGYSTGCHLHFMAWSGGAIINPHPLLP